MNGMNRILTEADLRAQLLPADTKEYNASRDTFVTPAAKDFLRERGIALVVGGEQAAGNRMPVEPIEKKGNATYINAATRQGYSKKPEEMTHLRSNLLVPKTHPRIQFRGKIDSLEAKVLELQVTAAEEGYPEICGHLGEVLSLLKLILAAEVKEEPLQGFTLMGLDEAGLRHVSHNVKAEIGIDHPVPHYSMGRLAIGLNSLRTEIRRVELAAVSTFTDPVRLDIIQALNRLSSGVYILFCRFLAGDYKGEKV
jgi:ethanolamine utilization cobalamin adenosyltransferase